MIGKIVFVKQAVKLGKGVNRAQIISTLYVFPSNERKIKEFPSSSQSCTLHHDPFVSPISTSTLFIMNAIIIHNTLS